MNAKRRAVLVHTARVLVAGAAALAAAVLTGPDVLSLVPKGDQAIVTGVVLALAAAIEKSARTDDNGEAK